MDNKNINEEVFECKMYITDLETNKKSKEINVSDLVFNDYIEFEFGNYEDEDYETLPYKDFKFFINDYSVTFYSPQYKKKCEELDQYKNNWEELKKYCEFQNNKLCKDPLKNQKSLSIVNWVLNKMKELEEDK